MGQNKLDNFCAAVDASSRRWEKAFWLKRLHLSALPRVQGAQADRVDARRLNQVHSVAESRMFSLHRNLAVAIETKWIVDCPMVSGIQRGFGLQLDQDEGKCFGPGRQPRALDNVGVESGRIKRGSTACATSRSCRDELLMVSTSIRPPPAEIFLAYLLQNRVSSVTLWILPEFVCQGFCSLLRRGMI